MVTQYKIVTTQLLFQCLQVRGGKHVFHESAMLDDSMYFMGFLYWLDLENEAYTVNFFMQIKISTNELHVNFHVNEAYTPKMN